MKGDPTDPIADDEVIEAPFIEGKKKRKGQFERADDRLFRKGADGRLYRKGPYAKSPYPNSAMRALACESGYEAIGIIRRAMLGEIINPLQLRAAEALLDRGYGRPHQSVEVTGVDGGTQQVEVKHVGTVPNVERLDAVFKMLQGAASVLITGAISRAASANDAEDDAVHQARADSSATHLLAADETERYS